MEDFKMNFAEELQRLEVQDEDEVTAKMLSTKFKKQALKHHPDKTGDVDNDLEFKRLLNDYNTLIEALKKINEDEVQKEKNEMADFLAKNNVAKENTQSYTVMLEKEKSTEWRGQLKKMKKMITDPKKLSDGGIQYKIDVHGNIISMTHYENPGNGQPKLHVQGSMFHSRVFIVDEMPKMYKAILEKTKKAETPSVKRKEITTNIGLTYACLQCDNEYKRRANLTKHIAAKHTNAATPTKEPAKKKEKKKQIKSLPVLSIEPIPLPAPKMKESTQMYPMDLTASQKIHLSLTDDQLNSLLYDLTSDGETEDDGVEIVSEIGKHSYENNKEEKPGVWSRRKRIS